MERNYGSNNFNMSENSRLQEIQTLRKEFCRKSGQDSKGKTKNSKQQLNLNKDKARVEYIEVNKLMKKF